ncbi:QLQ domain-containing protein [Trichonephila clavipes]|uniref:QLQ domain-containing protein n=1 Tax=Trichonephila clavipes TaxID=2585209 RepID=A0A8X6WKB0_TRICX|nr:QLQ domain-containing protein [Trichonephila clavipes]
MNSDMYVNILDNAALPTLWQYFGEGPFLFQQDNCFIHTSRLAQTPIEHLWDELERRLRSQPNRPSSRQALTSAVMDAWKKIPMVTYQKLVESSQMCAGCHLCKRGTNIILICASGH